MPYLDFLGQRVTSQGVLPMSDRVRAIREFPQLKDKPALQHFLGMVNYYHRFMPHIVQQ